MREKRREDQQRTKYQKHQKQKLHQKDQSQITLAGLQLRQKKRSIYQESQPALPMTTQTAVPASQWHGLAHRGPSVSQFPSSFWKLRKTQLHKHLRRQAQSKRIRIIQTILW